MDEWFKLGERESAAVLRFAGFLAAVALFAISVLGAIDAIDGLHSSSGAYYARQVYRHIAGELDEGEQEAKNLAAYAAAQARLPSLAGVRIWSSDKLADRRANGHFDPFVFKMTISSEFSRKATYEQRWLVFHEAGHAIQSIDGRQWPVALPSWGLGSKASETFENSWLYKQSYSESFADLFALSMALRLDAQDPKAISEMGEARMGRIQSVSLAHDTQEAMLLGAGRLGDLASLEGKPLLDLIDALAVQGSLRTVGRWGAQKEAICMVGLWGLAAWADDMGHAQASAPWKMAKPIPDGSSWDEALAELLAASPPASRQEELAAAKPFYEQAAASASAGDNSGPVGPISYSRPEMSPTIWWMANWGRALADFERAQADPARRWLRHPFSIAASIFSESRPQGCQAH